MKAEIPRVEKQQSGALAFASRLVSRIYLPVTFAISFVIAVTIAFFLHLSQSGDSAPSETALNSAVDTTFVVLFMGLLFTWPQWFYRKLNEILWRALADIQADDAISDSAFRKKAGSVFGEELVSNVLVYEHHCRNEYVLDMQKHHLAWLMLAVSGVITIAAALLVTFGSTTNNVGWIEAVGVTLPALVTSVLLKIWLETRANLTKTRDRTDAIYRQRIRLMLLIADHVSPNSFDLDQSIEMNSRLLNYIRLTSEEIGVLPVQQP